jgi:hypothetical protein
LPSITATQLLVVPRSIPIILPIASTFFSSILVINDYAVAHANENLAVTSGLINLPAWHFEKV